MASEIYSVDKRGQQRKKRRRRIIWTLVTLIFLGLIVALVIYILNMLKPKTVIKQATPIHTKVAYESKTTKYDEPYFTIDILKDWKQMPRPAGPYRTYTWQTSDSGTDGEVFTIYEDTIPPNFAVNRVLIVRGENDHLVLEGTASDNCIKYTRNGQATPGQVGALAKWQDVNFLCDVNNKQRDFIGTSSTDGVNTVILRGQTAGAHKYFFSYGNYNVANPDYGPFYDALNSLRMK